LVSQRLQRARDASLDPTASQTTGNSHDEQCSARDLLAGRYFVRPVVASGGASPVSTVRDEVAYDEGGRGNARDHQSREHCAYRIGGSTRERGHKRRQHWYDWLTGKHARHYRHHGPGCSGTGPGHERNQERACRNHE